MNNRQGERESGIIFSAGTAHPAVPQALADMRTADGLTYGCGYMIRSIALGGRGRAEKKMEWKKKCCFARPLGETVETRGDRAMIEEERREVGLSASEERLPNVYLPSFLHPHTDPHQPTYLPSAQPTPHRAHRHRVCTLTNEKPRGVLRKPLLPKYITLSMQSVGRATGVAASRWRAS